VALPHIFWLSDTVIQKKNVLANDNLGLVLLRRICKDGQVLLLSTISDKIAKQKAGGKRR
jgi:hypothetical protein